MKRFLYPTLVAIAGWLVLGPLGLILALVIYFWATKNSRRSAK